MKIIHSGYEAKFLAALPYITNLVHFSLKYDCTKSILQVLSETCWKTLRILDIERSTQIQDDSIDYSPNNFLQEKSCFSLAGQVGVISIHY